MTKKQLKFLKILYATGTNLKKKATHLAMQGQTQGYHSSGGTFIEEHYISGGTRAQYNFGLWDILVLQLQITELVADYALCDKICFMNE